MRLWAPKEVVVLVFRKLYIVSMIYVCKQLFSFSVWNEIDSRKERVLRSPLDTAVDR